MRKHDVVIIGGSLSGASCAIALRGGGIDVGVFERDNFPREKVCGEFLSPGTVRAFKQIGVLNDVLDAGAIRVDRGRIRSGNYTIEIPFSEPALGFSRERLDALLAGRAGVEHGCLAESVRRDAGVFITEFSGPSGRFEVSSKVIVDAAGKLSRFTHRLQTSHYGVQYHEEGNNSSVLDFEFFDGGYGGSVSIEDGRKTFCFLVDRKRLDLFRRKKGCIMTGPAAYHRIGGEYLAIGDATGMIDPFSGEGMHHALESALLAAGSITNGFRNGCGYDDMRGRYEAEWQASWSRKRALVSVLRPMLASSRMSTSAFALGVRFPKLVSIVLRELWK